MNYKRFQSNLIHLTTVDSTNNYAANLVKETNVVNGTTILTKRQDSGRGQRGNSWHTEPNKNLIVSTIVFPKLNVSAVFFLTRAVSLAVVKTLHANSIEAKIKWPNDIYVGKKKIAGILIENQIQGQEIHTAIIGLGLNINQVDFPAEIAATSMHLELGNAVELGHIFETYFSFLDFYIDLLMQSNFNLLEKRYLENLFQLNECCSYEDQNGRFDGEIIGIDSHGRLRIRCTDEIRVYALQEVRFVL